MRKLLTSTIGKIYVSNILTGLVFWYAIEKLFMKSIGISATGIGIATATYLACNMFLDIPAGILADRWSRKGTLFLSTVALGSSSIILGNSHSLVPYILGSIVYGMYMVTTSGTYQAMTYDALHEEGRADQYSKIIGRAYALFLGAAGVGSVASGFLAHHFGFRFTYFVTVIPCVLNGIIILSMREPRFHKAEHGEKVLAAFGLAAREIMRIQLLRALTIVWSVLFVTDIFKQDFGQLYMFRYVSSPQIIGLLWAAYAFTWALGSLVAHRLKGHLHLLISSTVGLLVLMSLIDNRLSLGLFMVQAVVAGAMFNQIETRIQDATPSKVRASILSLLSTLGRALAIPASIGIGYLTTHGTILLALRFIAALASLVLLYWLVAQRTFAPNALASNGTVPAK